MGQHLTRDDKLYGFQGEFNLQIGRGQITASQPYLQIKGSAGQVHGFHVVNPTTQDGYFHFWDLSQSSVAGAISANASPRFSYLVPAGGAVYVEAPFPLPFSQAITVSFAANFQTNSVADVVACNVGAIYFE